MPDLIDDHLKKPNIGDQVAVVTRIGDWGFLPEFWPKALSKQNLVFNFLQFPAVIHQLLVVASLYAWKRIAFIVVFICIWHQTTRLCSITHLRLPSTSQWRQTWLWRSSCARSSCLAPQLPFPIKRKSWHTEPEKNSAWLDESQRCQRGISTSAIILENNNRKKKEKESTSVGQARTINSLIKGMRLKYTKSALVTAVD